MEKEADKKTEEPKEEEQKAERFCLGRYKLKTVRALKMAKINQRIARSKSDGDKRYKG